MLLKRDGVNEVILDDGVFSTMHALPDTALLRCLPGLQRATAEDGIIAPVTNQLICLPLPLQLPPRMPTASTDRR